MAIINKRIYIGKKRVEAMLIRLSGKNLIILRGSKGYVMCGYLNLKVAEKFKDAAIKVVGVSSIDDALGSKVHALTSAARRLGVRRGQAVKEALKLIA